MWYVVCGVVRCGAVRCDMVWRSAVWCGMHCGVVRRGVVRGALTHDVLIALASRIFSPPQSPSVFGNTTHE